MKIKLFSSSFFGNKPQLAGTTVDAPNDIAESLIKRGKAKSEASTKAIEPTAKSADAAASLNAVASAKPKK